MRQCTEVQFLQDVTEHKMTVLCDNGVHRCIKFAQQGEHSWVQHFTITTWPWHLAISGDMGTFVFNRVEDMFQFFRTSPEKSGLYINTGYWGEKCEAMDRRLGMTAFDADLFKKCVREDFEYSFDGPAKEKRNCWRAIEAEVLYADNEHDAHQLAARFKFGQFEFTDFWEHNLKSYTFRYVWCCYAIAWGIRQYDLAHEPSEVAAGAR